MGTEGREVLLADDDASRRALIVRSLRDQHVVVTAGSFEDARNVLPARAWSAFVLGYRLRDGNALDWLGELRLAGRREPALVVASGCRAELVNRALLLEAQLLCMPFDSAHIGAFAQRLREQPPPPSRIDATSNDPLGTLTVRERMVFRLVVGGLSNTNVADELAISIKTVQTHRAKINEKLGVHGPGQLVRFAALRGLLPPDRSPAVPLPDAAALP
jgi:two-component system, LuxR family, response regulator DctR